ncbi:hypothetical protein [Rhizobium herbae]|uniref:Co-chaperone DjlA N-terminal domain-containing protein n=1 Tax=Rhizobium herbae TaxID=508661 RepID=A0ABS4EFC9_9HYPH|nr:hypothetical protein [Rhizobium herbae]MBP1856566.1 hypothetical protein [Rhizobium herbae]
MTTDDIGILREHVFVQGLASSQDAMILLAINGSCSEKCAEWHHYFIDSMTDFIVRTCYPQGAMDEWNADWLIAMISTRGVVNSSIELDLLFHIIDISTQIPDSLSIFALEQIRVAMTEDVGIWAGLRGNRHGLQKADILLIARVMSAVARSRGSHLTARERRMLDQIGVLTGVPGDHAAAA